MKKIKCIFARFYPSRKNQVIGEALKIRRVIKASLGAIVGIVLVACSMDGAYNPVSSSIETLKSIIRTESWLRSVANARIHAATPHWDPGPAPRPPKKKFIKIYWFSVGSSVSDSLSCSTAGSTYVYAFSDFLKIVSLDPTWHTVISSPSLMSSLLIASTPADR